MSDKNFTELMDSMLEYYKVYCLWCYQTFVKPWEKKK